MLAAWGAMSAIACVGLREESSWSDLHPDESFAPQGQSGLILLAAVVAGLVVGLAVGFACRRLGVVLFWSLLGSAATLLALLAAARPDYLTLLPTRAWEQAILAAVTVLFGAMVQWRLTFANSSPKAAKPD